MRGKGAMKIVGCTNQNYFKVDSQSIADQNADGNSGLIDMKSITLSSAQRSYTRKLGYHVYNIERFGSE